MLREVFERGSVHGPKEGEDTPASPAKVLPRWTPRRRHPFFQSSQDYLSRTLANTRSVATSSVSCSLLPASVRHTQRVAMGMTGQEGSSKGEGRQEGDEGRGGEGGSPGGEGGGGAAGVQGQEGAGEAGQGGGQGGAGGSRGARCPSVLSVKSVNHRRSSFGAVHNMPIWAHHPSAAGSLCRSASLAPASLFCCNVVMS